MENKYTREQIGELVSLTRSKYSYLRSPQIVRLVLEKTLSSCSNGVCDLAASVECIPTNQVPGAAEYKRSVLKLLVEELDEMPKYLSSNDPDLKVLSEWRLSIGR